MEGPSIITLSNGDWHVVEYLFFNFPLYHVPRCQEIKEILWTQCIRKNKAIIGGQQSAGDFSEDTKEQNMNKRLWNTETSSPYAPYNNSPQTNPMTEPGIEPGTS